MFNYIDFHRRHCCRKEGEKPHPKPRPKHPTKVHVWAGMSQQGILFLKELYRIAQNFDGGKF